jgi:hypothetical protein
MSIVMLGISRLDIPGKQALKRNSVQPPTVLKRVDWLRARADPSPLLLS